MNLSMRFGAVSCISISRMRIETVSSTSGTGAGRSPEGGRSEAPPHAYSTTDSPLLTSCRSKKHAQSMCSALSGIGVSGTP